MDMLKAALIDLVDGAMWEARGQYGHDDNGLQDWDTGDALDTHPEAVKYADRILKLVADLL